MNAVPGLDLRRPTISLIALVAANLVPLAGVLFLGWDAAMILLLYWSENLILGGFNVLKMLVARTKGRLGWVGKLLAIPFFCVHFGGFCAVHGLFLMLLLGMGSESTAFPTGGGTWPGPLVFLQLLVGVVSHAWHARPDGSGWPLLALAASHGISFAQNYLGRREYATLTIDRLMAEPYGRIALLHIAILAGAAPVMALHSPVPLLCVLVMGKIVLDVRLHVRAHRGEVGEGIPLRSATEEG